jgi:glycine/D-amino acid oxidase-like deaminating enzyme
MNNKYDAIVIGAGIVGAACAWELASAGMQVATIEAGTIGGGATAAGMGHIVIMDDSPAQLALTRFAQSLWNDLAPRLPVDVDYDRCGTLWIAADEEELAAVDSKHRTYSSVGISTELLGSREIASTEPNLRRPLAGALRVPSDAVLYPQRAAEYLVACAQQAGAEVFMGKAVIRAGDGQLRLEDGTVLSSPRIIHATGASATRLIPDLPIKKRKGHVVVTDQYPGLVHHQLIEMGYMKSAHSVDSDSVAFNIQPRRTGQVVIGSSRQYEDESSKVNQTILTAMLDRASTYLPRLHDLSSFRVWTGFRAATPDKLPLIGPTGDRTVFLATGHEGLGITTSLATAHLLVNHLLDRDSAIPIDPYLPERLTAQEKI